MLIALLVGFGIAYAGALPVAGPVAVLIVARALAGRRREALGMSLGAALPEGIYAGASALGAAALVERVPAAIPVAHAIGGVIVLGVGVSLLLRQSKAAPNGPPGRPSHGSVLTALLLTALNPTLIVTWTAVSTPLVAAGAITGVGGAVAFGCGAAAGAGMGGATLAYLLTRHRWRLGGRGVRLARHGAGIVLVLFGLFFLARAL